MFVLRQYTSRWNQNDEPSNEHGRQRLMMLMIFDDGWIIRSAENIISQVVLMAEDLNG